MNYHQISSNTHLISSSVFTLSPSIFNKIVCLKLPHDKANKMMYSVKTQPAKWHPFSADSISQMAPIQSRMYSVQTQSAKWHTFSQCQCRLNQPNGTHSVKVFVVRLNQRNGTQSVKGFVVRLNQPNGTHSVKVFVVSINNTWVISYQLERMIKVGGSPSWS